MKLRDFLPLAKELARENAFNLGLIGNDDKKKDKKQILAIMKKDQEDGVLDNVLKAIPFDEAYDYYSWGVTGVKPKNIPSEDKTVDEAKKEKDKKEK